MNCPLIKTGFSWIQVTTACRYTNDLLNMMHAKLDDFQANTKTSTLSLGNGIEHCNTTLDRVCENVATLESTARHMASAFDLSSTNNEKRLEEINLSLEEIVTTTNSINLAQEKTSAVVSDIVGKSDEIASSLTVNDDASRIALSDIQQKVVNLADKTVSITNVQDEVTKCLMDKLTRSSCTLESIDSIIKRILTLQDSTFSSVENVERVTGLFLNGRELDKKELNAALGNIHERLAAVQTCTKDIASVQTDASATLMQSHQDVTGCLDSVKNINSAIFLLQDAAASSITKLDLLETSINGSLLLTKSPIENKSSNLNIVLDEIHGKVSKIDEKVDRIVTAQDSVQESVVEELQKCNTKLESIDEVSKEIKAIHNATSLDVGNIHAKADVFFATQGKHAKDMLSNLEMVNSAVSEVVLEVKQSSHASNVANVALAKSIGELGLSCDSIVSNTKSILSLNESTSLSISNLERINSEIESEVLSKNATRESEMSNLNLVLEQLQGQLTELSTASDNHASSHTVANSRANEYFLKLVSSIEDIDERIRDVQLTQQAEAQGIDKLNEKADLIFSSKEKDMLEVNTSIRSIGEKVSIAESLVKKVDHLTSALDTIDAENKLIPVLRDEIKRSTSVFERLNNCLNEQLMSSSINIGRDQSNAPSDQVCDNVAKVGHEIDSSVECGISSIEGINKSTNVSQLGENHESLLFYADKSSTGKEPLVLNQENIFTRYMELPSTVCKESSGSLYHQETMHETKKGRDVPIEEIARPFLDTDLNQNLERDSNIGSSHISQLSEHGDFITMEAPKNHENQEHKQNNVTIPNIDVVSSANGFQSLQLSNEHSNIKEAVEVRQLSSCSDVYTELEIAIQNEVNNERSEEASTEELEKVSCSDSEHGDYEIEESPEDNHDMSEQNLKEGNNSAESHDTPAIEKNHQASDSSKELHEDDEEIKLSAGEQDKDLEAIAKLTIIHATALVYVGLIQVDAIESAATKIG